MSPPGPTQRTGPAPASPRLLVAAALSGAAALMHEMVWTRDLSMYVGATWPAATVVVAGFMGGLGVGSYLGGRWMDEATDRKSVV